MKSKLKLLINWLIANLTLPVQMDGNPTYQELRLVPVGVQENANSCSIDLPNLNLKRSAGSGLRPAFQANRQASVRDARHQWRAVFCEAC